MIAPRPTRTVFESSAKRPSQSIDDLDAAICRLAREINAESYRLLLLVREFDDRLGWSKWSFRNCAEWLAWRCGLSLSAAREKVRAAQALRELPAISAAFAAGRLSYTKVRALTRVAHAHDEDLLLAYALDATAVQLEERCRQIRNTGPESVERAQQVWARRSLSVSRNPATGALTITIEVPIEEGEIITHAIDRAVETGEAANGPEFAENSWHGQQADALVAIAKAYLGGGAGGAAEPTAAGAADHYQVVVHVDEAALRGGISVNNSAACGVIARSDLPIETVRRLTCDGNLITIVEDERGTPLALGRKQRTVSTPLKRALWSRDRGCSFPGCHHTRYLDAHHIRHWADGGGTSLDNLTLLCSHHHRLLHEGAFRIKRDYEGAIYFRRADGRVIPRDGYRSDDFLDDSGTTNEQVGHHSERASAVWAGAFEPEISLEARLATLVRARKPSAAVRETAGVYCV